MNQTVAAFLIVTTSVTCSMAQQRSLNCNVGPITKTYGGSNWLVYSCDDNQSVAFLAAPNNPVTPFYFLLSKRDGSYRVEGEGTGNKNATSAAVAEIGKLSETEITAVIEQTRKR